MNGPSSSESDVKEEKRPSLLQRIESHVQSRTLAGLIELVPLLVTIVVLLFIISHADNFVRPMAFVRGKPWDFIGIGLIVLIVVFYIVGLVISTRYGRRAMDLISTVLSRVPVVRTLFGVAQQATTALTSQHNFSRVVFLEWPREGMAAMGFVTGRVQSTERTESLVLVYIPTIPNPTSGNMALVLEDEVIETDLTVEDAMKLVFSGGIVLPKAVSLARVPRVAVDHPVFVGRFEPDTD